MRLLLCLTGVFALTATSAAQVVSEGRQDNGPKISPEKAVEQWKIGLVVTAKSGPCGGMVGSFTLPGDWPEQEVRILNENFSPLAVVTDRMIDTVKQLVVTIDRLPAGDDAPVLVTVEITRHPLLPPGNTSDLLKVSPKKLPKDVRIHLGPSPGIETQHGKIKALAKNILQQSSAATDWERVEVIFDWVRKNIEPRDKQTQPSAYQTLRDKASNHEGLCWLFIALCRVSEIPARTVWVPKYCYPEFYLQDREGRGYWFPCRVAGVREFGGIDERRPIWQKGDNFRMPERPREAVHYLPPELTGKGGEPSVNFVREPAGG
ncbi:MAG TPA: transglutaminase domain-containing protein [Pirellulales bacterium]|nr:transglutaminase domain-containing protein [Pirellulales bacterium]